MPDLSSFVLSLFLGTNIILGLCASVDMPTHFIRGLGLWEKVSHPIDAFFIGLSMYLGFLATTKQSTFLFWTYCLLALVTIALSYKDEFIHQKECPGFEQVMHAIMFTCSGISLAAGSVMILLGIGAQLFFLGFLVGVLFFVLQLILNFFTKAPRPTLKNY